MIEVSLNSLPTDTTTIPQAFLYTSGQTNYQYVGQPGLTPASPSSPPPTSALTGTHTSTDTQYYSGPPQCLLLLATQIDKVWSDQNENTLGDMSNNNYFTNQSTSGTGAGIIYGDNNTGPIVPNNFLTMGFRGDSAYIKAHIQVPGCPQALKNMILVRVVNHLGGPQFNAPQPMANPVSYANGIDSGTDIATLTCSDAAPCIGAMNQINASDWNVVLGFDTNEDGQLEASEITTTSKYPIRAIDEATYLLDVGKLVAVVGGGNSIFLNRTFAAYYLAAFLTNSSVEGSDDNASGPTIILPSEPIPYVPQSIQENVGALFNSSGTATIFNNSFDVDSELSIEVEGSPDFHKYIKGFLDSHATAITQLMSQSPGDSVSATWIDSSDFTGLSFDDDDVDLEDALHNVEVGRLTISVVVNPNGSLEQLTCSGYIEDVYEFYWPIPGVNGWLGQTVITAAMQVQAGYNTLGLAAGHIFESTINLNLTNPDPNHLSPNVILPYSFPAPPSH
jgi:hypothetical protein